VSGLFEKLLTDLELLLQASPPLLPRSQLANNPHSIFA
jgi:hypothetical protein